MAKVKASNIMPIDMEISSPSDCNHNHVAAHKIGNTTVQAMLNSNLLTLLPREAHILYSMLSGKRNTQIAQELGIDEMAVKEHVKSILRRIRKIKNGDPNKRDNSGD